MDTPNNKEALLSLTAITFILCLFPFCGRGGSNSSTGRKSKLNPKNDTTLVQVISTNTRTGFVDMQKALRFMPDSVDKTNAPDNIYHGAIALFGKVFDFIAEEGLVVTDEESYMRENVPLWIDGVFLTNRTEIEFMTWIQQQRSTVYTNTSYDLVDNNCLTFVADAIQFLGGTEPQKLTNLKEFALKNRDNIELLKGLAKAANTHKEIELRSVGAGGELQQ